MQIKRLRKYALWAIVLFIIYVVVGIFLVEKCIVKSWPLPFNGQIGNGGSTHHGNSKAGIDGPHIFYKDNNIFVKSIARQDTSIVGILDTLQHKDSVTINCNIEHYKTWNFTTTLKSKLSNEPSTYREPDSLIAISDIEGEFEAFRNLLLANYVIDSTYNWTYGTGHLILVGDFFDRGQNVTEVLWLIYKLEQEAEKQGGKVHFILGNHEIMNMQDDIRYVSNKYLENAKLINADYKLWYKEGTELGDWLATKNIIEKVGPILFTHGGISDKINDLGLSVKEINSIAKPYYYHYSKDSDKKRLQNEYLDIFFSSKISPFWYRGYVKEKATQKQVDKTLEIFHVQTIVIGHSTVDNITMFYNDKVIDIDTKHSEGNSQGLYYCNDKYYSINKAGERKLLK